MDITPIHFILSMTAGFLVFVVLPAMLLIAFDEDMSIQTKGIAAQSFLSALVE